MHLENAIECFLLLAEMERRPSAGTLRLYSRALQKLEAYAREKGRSKLEDLTPNLLRAAVAHEMQPKQVGNSVNWRGGEGMGAAMVAATRTMLRRLQAEYPELPLPDLSMVKAPKVPQRIQPRLGDGEFVRLEAALRMRLLRDRVPRFLIARDMAILELLSNTGLRAAECCGLNLDDLDLEEGTVRIRHGKGDKWRILTIIDPEEPRDGGEIIRALEDYLRYRERTFGTGFGAALWLTVKGNRLNTEGLRVMLSTLCDEAGIDGNRPPHAFRRAYFTEQYREQPMALPVLVERMGWSTPAMSKIYTRGVDIELARRIPMPLMSKHWRGNGPKVPSSRGRDRPMINTGVGFRGGSEATAGRRPPYTGDDAQTASVNSRRGSSRHPQ